MRDTNIQVPSLTKTYGKDTVLHTDSFEFSPGKIYAIIGANGSGKSTFLKLLAGIIKSDNKAKTDFGDSKICYMPQKNYAFSMSVLKNVLITSKNKSADKARALELMEMLKIDRLANRQAKGLSGGETARMALCRAVLSNADILLLDEPTAAMDIESTLLSEELIRNYTKKKCAAVIMVTHSVNQAKRLADEIIFMKDGKILEYGTADEVLHFPKLSDTKEFLEFFSAEI